MSENKITGNLFYFARGAANADVLRAAPAGKPEARLVERIRAGDREAFGEFYKRFAPTIHGIVLARVPRSEADDIVQNVFVAAYKNINAVRDPNNVGAWLAQIARNQSIEYFRARKPTEDLPEELREKDNRNHEASEILTIIRALPDAYRETLILRLVEGMTGAEIAERTGLTNDSVRVNLHRGMKMLREKIGAGEKR